MAIQLVDRTQRPTIPFSSEERAQSFESPRLALDIPLSPLGLRSFELMTQIPLTMYAKNA
jgi:hypothetical protein